MECVVLRQCFLLQRSILTRHPHPTGLRQKSIYGSGALHPHSPARQRSNLQVLEKNQQALLEPGSRIQLSQEGRSQDEEPEDEGGGGREDSVEAESVKLLEWLSVCEQVSRFASTPMARDLCRKGCLSFGRDQEESEKLLEQTASALLIPSPLDFGGVVDVSAILRSVMGGDVLNVRELCVIEKMLSSSKRVYDQLHNCIPAASLAEVCKSQSNKGPVSSSRSTSSALAPLLSIMKHANFCTSLVQAINMSLDSSSLAILDTASSNLLAIRASRKENMKTLESLLLEIGGKVVAVGGMDSVIVTTRRARLCVAVRASHKHLLLGGVVLDMSNTGATVFMEPKAALELNNNEVQLASKERAEESLILKRLTQKVADVVGDIWSLLEKITHLDLACAKAGHGRWLSSVKPTFSLTRDLGGKQDKGVSEGSKAFWVCIEGLSHPLLLGQALLRREEQEDASFPVPLDFKVKSSVRVIVISGPNTGGKTASMKTFGMAALMAKAGLFVPAKGMAVLPWFDQVLADIGDSQSLEQSLSTFSGHIHRVCSIMEAASYKSLVLFDEIGSGTDPSEGAALASAILEHMADNACLTIVTTHFSKLSRFMDERFEVASVEFDIETLRPKYTVLWGVAGQSNALDIASSLGVDEDILTRARHWMRMLAPENEEQRAAQLMDPLIQQRSVLKSQAEAAALLLFDAKKLHDELAAEADSLQTRIGALQSQREDRVKKEVNVAKSHMEQIVSNFESSSKGLDKNEKSTSMGEALSAIASVVDTYMKVFDAPVKASVQLEAANRPSVGDTVLIRRLGKKSATVIEGPTEDDESFLVQLGGLKVRAKLSEVTKVFKPEKIQQVGPQRMKRIAEPEEPPGEEVRSGLVLQTSRNSVDLRGMRVDEALMNLDFAFLKHRHSPVFFVIHGEGTGALRAAVLERLKGHPLVLKFEQESPMNYGCTAVYLK